MNNSQKGFGKLTLIMLIAIIAIMYFMKNDRGVSYLEDIYNKVRYYIVDRNTNAIQKARETKTMMQADQNRLKQTLEEY